jgi:acetyltransferase-like isoleucine patch superfamily enzyme
MKSLKELTSKANNKIGFFRLFKLYLQLRKVKFGVKTYFKNRPIIRNKGTIIIGARVTFDSFPDGEFCRTRIITNHKSSKIIIGDDSVLRGTTVWASTEIMIGDNFLAAPYVWIVDSDAHGVYPTERAIKCAKSAPIIIGNNVWIGYRALVLKGARIGDNTIIGAGAVVTHDIPANSVAAGVPAKVIKKLKNG